MAFVKFPFLLMLLAILFTGGRIVPFILIGFGIWILLGVMSQVGRYEPKPTVTTDELDELRNDVAVSLLYLDNDDRVKSNPDVRTRIRTASRYYARASAAVDRGVSRRDRNDVARALYRARYELEAASAELEGQAAPEPPDELRTGQRVAVATRPQVRRYRVGCRW